MRLGFSLQQPTAGAGAVRSQRVVRVLGCLLVTVSRVIVDFCLMKSLGFGGAGSMICGRLFVLCCRACRFRVYAIFIAKFLLSVGGAPLLIAHTLAQLCGVQA